MEFYGESEAELTSKMDALKEDMARRRLGYASVNLLDRAPQVLRVHRRVLDEGKGLGIAVNTHQ